jgi:hypothetical protein
MSSPSVCPGILCQNPQTVNRGSERQFVCHLCSVVSLLERELGIMYVVQYVTAISAGARI